MLAASLLALLVLAQGCKAPPSREKTDVVQLANGDRITGEIKRLERGKLRLKTTALDTVYVEWDKVAELSSTYAFEFESTQGTRHFGRLTIVAPGMGRIDDEDGSSVTLPLLEIVEITPIEESFLARLDGNFSLGFNYSRGSDVGQLQTDADVQHRTRQTRTELDLSFTITKDSEEERTSRDSLSMTHTRYRERWFGWFQGLLEQNESLGLDVRTSVAAGGGRSLISTSSTVLDLGAGLSFSEENSADSASGSSVVEGVLRVAYSIFRFTGREVDSDFELLVYPGITESGRVRGELDASVRREIAKDFFVQLSGYYSYDNEPPAGAEERDYGIYTSLGWSL